MVYYLHETENMGAIGCRNLAQLCFQISLMMRLQKLSFHCFHILNLLASGNWFWMPFICHWAGVKGKTMIYHVLLTHLFIAQLLLLRKRHLMCSSKETESTFHFPLIDESVTERKSCSPHLQYPGGVIRGRGNGAGIQLGSGLKAEASRAVRLCPVLFAWKEQCKVNIDAVLWKCSSGYLWEGNVNSAVSLLWSLVKVLQN